MSVFDRQALLNAATPRPWIVSEFDDSYGDHYKDVRPADGEAIIVYGEDCFLPEMETANLRLIVAAVNEYEHLLACEAGLRALVGFLRPDNQHARHAREALEALDEARR